MLSLLKEAIVRQSFVDSIRRGDVHNGFVSRIGQKRPSFHLPPLHLASQTFPPKFRSKSSRNFVAAEEEKEEEEKTIVAMVIKMARQLLRATFSRDGAFEKKIPSSVSGTASRMLASSLLSMRLNPLHYSNGESFVSSLSPRKRRNCVSLKNRSFTLFSSLSIVPSNRGSQPIVVRISAIFFFFLFLPPSKVAQS